MVQIRTVCALPPNEMIWPFCPDQFLRPSMPPREAFRRRVEIVENLHDSNLNKVHQPAVYGSVDIVIALRHTSK
jgi:hypothetical protein